MALVVVLWLVVLLGVIATSHSSNARMTTRLAGGQVELAQLRTTAQAGLQRAILELLAQGNAQPWPVNGSKRSVSILGNEVTIAIRDATGLLDLNSATPQLLSALVDAGGAAPEVRQALVDAILDWRDADSLSRLNGAEEYAYPSEQLGWTIRNGPFAAIEELRYVVGMTAEYYEKLAGLVTVYSGQRGVNLEYAPPMLIRALTGEEVASVSSTLSDDPRMTSRRAGNSARAGTFHVTINAASAKSTSIATLEAVIRIAPTADKPFTVLRWQEPMRPQPRVSG